MRYGFKLARRLLGGMVVLAVVLVLAGYVVYAANGIINEAQARDMRESHDQVMGGTATALAVGWLEVPASPVEVQPTEPALVAPTMTETATATATETPTATVTFTAVPPTVTPLPTNTLRPTVATALPTNTPRVLPTMTPLVSPTLTASATPTIAPSSTLTSTATITPRPTIAASATYVIQGTYAAPLQPPVVEIPPRVPLIEDDDNIVNFLLLGSDTTGGGVGHTDVIILVSVNRDAESVAMWHVPRDLFVYIPNYTMDRINTAYALGEMNNYPGGGFGLMKETILYNFGIEIDHYARVDFADFMRIVDELGGLDVSIDCAIRDWRLIEPSLDQTVEANWEQYTMPIGRQRLTPYMALWYVRSRVTTNDFDRGRRQMDVLRAMWHQANAQGLFTQVTQLWPEAVQVVETDMTLTDVLSYVPLAVSLDMSNIARYSGQNGIHYTPFVTPDDGREVVLPNRDELVRLIQDFLTPPTANRLGRQAATVEIWDASAFYLGFDLVAADRLAWEGFVSRPMGTDPNITHELTVVYDYTGQTKGSVLEDLMRVLRISDSQIISQPNPNRSVDFRVEIGSAYNSCVQGDSESSGPPIPTEEAE